MVRDALRGYLGLASGLTEVTIGRATTAAKALVAQGEATAEQVTSLADDLVESSRRNRDAMATLVRYEVEQTLRRVGLAPADEVVTLTERVRKLEATVRDLRAELARERSGAVDGQRSSSGGASGGGAATRSPAKKSAAKKSPATRAPAKKAPAKKAAKTAPAKKTSGGTEAGS